MPEQAATFVFSTSCYEYLRDELCKDTKFIQGQLERRQFADGEHYLRIMSQIEGQDVVVVGTTIPGGHFMELYDLAAGLVSYGVKSLTVIVPYFAYSTMERAVKHGEVVTAKNRAMVLSSLPQADWNNRIVMLDLHSDGISQYFEGAMRAYHLSAKAIVTEKAREFAGGDFVLASTDAGRAKWVESLAKEMKVDPAFVLKKRLGEAETKVVAPASPIEGRVVVIYDDMIRSGASLLEAAKSYLDAGASEIYAICTHGIFTSEALSKIKDSGLIRRVACTNSYPKAASLGEDFLEVLSVAPIFRDYLTMTRGGS